MILTRSETQFLQERQRRCQGHGDHGATLQSNLEPDNLETAENPEEDEDEDVWDEDGCAEGGDEEIEFEEDRCSEDDEQQRPCVQPFHSAETRLFLAILVSCVVGRLRPRFNVNGWNILRLFFVWIVNLVDVQGGGLCLSSLVLIWVPDAGQGCFCLMLCCCLIAFVHVYE